MLPLEGTRIIDLTTVAMGPLASQWLGDFGADVIKVEGPGGDTTRSTGPAAEPWMAATFLGSNRNKRSVLLNLKKERDRAQLLTLVDTADVFMHNIRPQKLEGLGIAPHQLTSRNPRLVYASLNGFGKDGPYGGRPAYDDIIQGMSGCVDLMRRQTGTPQYYPTIVADKTTGLIAAMSILAGLYGRNATGRGTVIEIPMFECMAGFNLVEHLFGQVFRPARGAAGYPRVLSPNRRPYRTTDGTVCVLPYTDAHWRDFFHAAGRSELSHDPRFSSQKTRTENIDVLYQLLAEIVSGNSTEYWLEACERAGVPAAPVIPIEKLADDPHLVAVDFFSSLDDPVLGEIRLPGVPILFDGQRPPCRMPPRLGEHNAELFEH